MKPHPPRTHPDDPFVPSRPMRWRITAARVWWRHPRVRRMVTVLLAAGLLATAVIVAARHMGGPAHCVTIPVRPGGGIRSCSR